MVRGSRSTGAFLFGALVFVAALPRAIHSSDPPAAPEQGAPAGPATPPTRDTPPEEKAPQEAQTSPGTGSAGGQEAGPARGQAAKPAHGLDMQPAPREGQEPSPRKEPPSPEEEVQPAGDQPITLSGFQLDLNTGALRPGVVTYAGGAIRVLQRPGGLRAEIENVELGDVPGAVPGLRGRVTGGFDVTGLPVKPVFEGNVVVENPGLGVFISSRRIKASVRGTKGAWVAEGEIEGGGWHLGVPLSPVTDIQGRFRIEGGALALTGLRGTMGGGPATIQGKLVRPPRGGAVDLAVNLRARSAILVRSDELRVRADLDLKISGPSSSPLVEGQVAILRGVYEPKFSLTHGVGPAALSSFQAFSTTPGRVHMDIAIKSRRGVAVRSPLATGVVVPELRLTGTTRELFLSGRVDTEEGTITVASSEFRIRSGRIDLNEPIEVPSRLEIHAGAVLKDHEVSLIIRGTLRTPRLVLSSAPPLPPDELLVLATTGKTLLDIQREGEDPQEAVRRARFVEGELSQGRPAGPTGLAGSFLERISITRTGPRRPRETDATRVEYRLGEHLYVVGERDRFGDSNIDIGYRLEWR